MKTLLIKIILLCVPLFFVGANMQEQPKERGFIFPDEAMEMIRQHKIDAVDTQLLLYESGIEMNLTEIKFILSQKKQPYKVLK